MRRNSMVNVAYEILKERNEKMTFNALWNEVCEKLRIDGDEKIDLISEFYTELTLDGRFIYLEGMHWDLRTNHTYEEFSKEYHYDGDDDADSSKEDDEEDEDLYDEEDEDEDEEGYNDSEEESY